MPIKVEGKPRKCDRCPSMRRHTTPKDCIKYLNNENKQLVRANNKLVDQNEELRVEIDRLKTGKLTPITPDQVREDHRVLAALVEAVGTHSAEIASLKKALGQTSITPLAAGGPDYDLPGTRFALPIPRNERARQG